MKQQTILTPAQLTWQDTTPVSVLFEDFYFSTDGGLNESRYVFLKPNRLPERFCEGDLSQPFIIAETGFGTGLNFLVSWQAWQEQALPKRPLHFFSVEKHPLNKDDLTKSLSNWPELNNLIQPLIDQYPPIVSGLQTLEFDNGQVRLSLLFGDISTDLSLSVFEADAWYLDGFAPKKNPDMWSENFFQLVAEKSKNSSTFSTFTSASIVRKGLENVGFNVSKKEGFGKKREMLFGYFSPSEQITTTILTNNLWSYQKPELAKPALLNYHQNKANCHYDVAVVGAGLAGLATAYELAQQGLKVCILDQNAGPVKGASGQSQLAMYAKLPSEANKLFHFIIQALNGSIRFYRCLQSNTKDLDSSNFWHQTGLMQLAWNDKESIKQKSFLKNIQLPNEIIQSIDAKVATEKSGLDIQVDALWFEKAGWLDPVKYADAILSSLPIRPLFKQRVNDLSFNEKTQSWLLSTDTKSNAISANYVVITNSNDAQSFPQISHLPSKPLRGQVTSIKHDSLKTAKTVVCGEGYLCPAINNWHHFGATFDLKCNEAIIKESDTEQNINSLKQWMPEWLQDTVIQSAKYHHSAGLRCTTPDYLPIVGQAPIADKMIQDFAKLRVDSNACKEKYGSYYPNLFVNIGHGSKGLFTTPLAAQIIRYHICGGLPPCLEEHRVMLSPARFIIKHLTQRRL
jgi:tRNA 5-methylaminomethyl-2-thiouridine biosynthesis bifunctional protein